MRLAKKQCVVEYVGESRMIKVNASGGANRYRRGVWVLCAPRVAKGVCNCC